MSTDVKRPPSEDSDDGGAGTDDDERSGKVPCLYCKKEKITYATYPCNHAGACKKCAMKTGSGGKCKKCGAFFASWTRLN